MNLRWCLLGLFLTPMLQAADLPTVTVEHLYYLQARSERVRKFRPDEMIEYAIVQKLGGPAFDHLYSQLITGRLELAKLLRVDEVPPNDARIIILNKTQEEYSKLLREEAQKIQNGLLREGQVATDTLQAIAQAQRQQ